MLESPRVIFFTLIIQMFEIHIYYNSAYMDSFRGVLVKCHATIIFAYTHTLSFALVCGEIDDAIRCNVIQTAGKFITLVIIMKRKSIYSHTSFFIFFSFLFENKFHSSFLLRIIKKHVYIPSTFLYLSLFFLPYIFQQPKLKHV